MRTLLNITADLAAIALCGGTIWFLLWAIFGETE
jgi:hypothetical protein